MNQEAQWAIHQAAEGLPQKYLNTYTVTVRANVGPVQVAVEFAAERRYFYIVRIEIVVDRTTTANFRCYLCCPKDNEMNTIAPR